MDLLDSEEEEGSNKLSINKDYADRSDHVLCEQE
jgi:hypothetical protein